MIANALDSFAFFNCHTGMSVDYQLERDRAHKKLLDLILSGKIDLQGPLSERKLADLLQMGRTPVREAMRELARDGVLDVRPARGTFVRKLSPEDVREIYEVRLGLEGTAAFLAAEHGPTEELSAFGDRFEALMKDPELYDLEETYLSGAAFHLAVFRAAQNKQLLAIYEPLRLRFRLALGLPRYYDHDWVHETVGGHLKILRAIERRDGPLAQNLICNHLAEGLEVRTRIFNRLRDATLPGAAMERIKSKEFL